MMMKLQKSQLFSDKMIMALCHDINNIILGVSPVIDLHWMNQYRQDSELTEMVNSSQSALKYASMLLTTIEEVVLTENRGFNEEVGDGFSLNKSLEDIHQSILPAIKDRNMNIQLPNNYNINLDTCIHTSTKSLIKVIFLHYVLNSRGPITIVQNNALPKLIFHHHSGRLDPEMVISTHHHIFGQLFLRLAQKLQLEWYESMEGNQQSLHLNLELKGSPLINREKRGLN